MRAKTPRKQSGKGKGSAEAEIEPIKQENGKIAIEKGIPIPVRSARNSLIHQFPLKSMDVGDSFLVEIQHSREAQNSLSTNIRNQAKKLKIKFKFSVFRDPNSEHMRVWRRE
jgi:hypothetical protein